jgi:hypothetical protein
LPVLKSPIKEEKIDAISSPAHNAPREESTTENKEVLIKELKTPESSNEGMRSKLSNNIMLRSAE